MLTKINNLIRNEFALWLESFSKFKFHFMRQSPKAHVNDRFEYFNDRNENVQSILKFLLSFIAPLHQMHRDIRPRLVRKRNYEKKIQNPLWCTLNYHAICLRVTNQNLNEKKKQQLFSPLSSFIPIRSARHCFTVWSLLFWRFRNYMNLSASFMVFSIK